MAFSLDFVVLKALSQEEDAFEGKDFLAGVAKIVAADLDLVFELRSVFGVERSLGVEELEEDDADGPDVGLVGVVGLLDDLGGHVEGRAANGLVDLLQPLQLLRKPEVSNFNLKRCV